MRSTPLRQRIAIAPLAVSVLLRVALTTMAYLLTGTTVMTQGDTASYLEPGRNLLLHGSYTTAGLPEMDRTPGYPLFAMLSGMLFDNVLLVIAVQIAISMLSLVLIQRIATVVFSSSRAGLFAAWMYALEPFSILYCVRVMPETLFVLLLIVATERLIFFLRTGKIACLALCGIALAAATYVRPVSYYLVLPLAAGLIVVCRKEQKLRWKAPLLLLITTLPLLAAWQIRNFVETGYSGFSSIVEKNLYFFQSAEVTAESQRIPLEQEQKRLGYPDEASYLAQQPEQRNWSQSNRLRFMKDESLRVLAAHPALYLKTHLVGVGIVAFTPGTAELLQMVGAYPKDGGMPHRMLNEGIVSSIRSVITTHPAVATLMFAMDAWLLLLYVLTARACILGKGNPKVWLLVGVASYFLLISGGAQAVGRYRLPVLPALCILAGGNVKRPGLRDQSWSQSGPQSFVAG